MNEFITRSCKAESRYEVIIKTDSEEHYKATEDFARRLIDHAKPKTNADRIQEKLAETLSGMCKIAEQCDFCPLEGNCPGGSYDLHVWSEWLQQPAEGE